VSGVGYHSQTVRRERGRLRFALLASLLFHLGLLFLVRGLQPPPAHRAQAPVSFTLIERPARGPEPRPLPQRPTKAAPGANPRASTHPGMPKASSGAGLGLPAAPDAPLAPRETLPPSLQAMSERAAEWVVKQRGAQHAPGDSAGERLLEALARGTGAMAVQRSGYWDAYFSLLRKALLKAWMEDRTRPHFEERTSTRVRVVLDADGLVLDFDISSAANSPLAREVEQALHQTSYFPPPPEAVLHGKAELVTEWVFTAHPGLALAQGTPVFGPFGPGIIFDVVTVVNPQVDLAPLEFNVRLASYWTR
jgi:hypothetical protein